MPYNGVVETKAAVRRAREKAQLREAILSAARRILVDEGYQAISIRAVADAVEYSAAALYLHFQDKESILAELALEGFDRLAVRLKSVQTDSAFPLLLGQAEQYLEFALENPRLYELMFLSAGVEFFTDDVEAAANGPECFRLLISAVILGQEQGVLTRQLPVPLLAYSLWGSLHGLATLAVSKRFFWIPEEQIPNLFREHARAMLVGHKP